MDFEPGHTAAEFRARHNDGDYVRGRFMNIHGSLEFLIQKAQATPSKYRSLRINKHRFKPA